MCRGFKTPRGAGPVAANLQALLHRYSPGTGGGHHDSAGPWRNVLALLYFGIGLQKISLGSLIIAVKVMARKMAEGFDSVCADTCVCDVTAMPMLTGTLITAVGFLPIGLTRLVTGEYIYAIFVVTAIALVLSSLVSVYLVPYLRTLLLKKPEDVVEKAQDDHSVTDDEQKMFDSPFYSAFRKAVNWCVKYRWVTSVRT